MLTQGAEVTWLGPEGRLSQHLARQRLHRYTVYYPKKLATYHALSITAYQRRTTSGHALPQLSVHMYIYIIVLLLVVVVLLLFICIYSTIL